MRAAVAVQGALQEYPCWNSLLEGQLWELGPERFLGFHKGGWREQREHKEIFSFSCGGVKVKNESGDRTPDGLWMCSALGQFSTAELGALSGKSRKSEAITKWDLICGCAFGGPGHPLHPPLCITIKYQTGALNPHLGQQEPLGTNCCVRNFPSLMLEGQ